MGAFVCTHAGALHTLRALVVQHHPLCPCIQISLLPLCPPWNSFHLPSLSSPKLLFPQFLCSFLKNRYQVLFNIDFSVLFWLFNWRIIALQWCVDFCHQQCESAMSTNMSPPSGASVPTLLSSHVLCKSTGVGCHCLLKCSLSNNKDKEKTMPFTLKNFKNVIKSFTEGIIKKHS